MLGALKRRINPKAHDLGLYILGGKGRYAGSAQKQIVRVSDKHGLPGHDLVKACRLAGRVDNSAVQDGFGLYQQYFILSDEGEWTSISQGMNKSNRRARRYHWHSPTVRSFTDSPHTGIVGIENQKVLNLVDGEANSLRDNMVALTQESPRHVIDAIRSQELPDRHDVRKDDVNLTRLGSVLNLAYNRDVENFDELVLMHGVGPRTLKALAMASEVIHGDATRFEDPARFSFAVGGKDGRPYPIDEQAFDETIGMLQNSVDRSKLGDKDKSSALKRLHKVAVKGESVSNPMDFLGDLIEGEWNHAEQNGGKTFMGKVVKGLTRKIMDTQNGLLYGNQHK